MDATDFLRRQEKRIIRLVLDQKKSLILFVNKWDCCDDKVVDRKRLLLQLHTEFPSLKAFPLFFGSAKHRQGLEKLLNSIVRVLGQSVTKVSTPKLNQFIQSVVKRHPLPSQKSRQVKFFYATQLEVSPPHFVFFVKFPELVSDPYKRFLEKEIRLHLFPYEGSPVFLSFRSRR